MNTRSRKIIHFRYHNLIRITIFLLVLAIAGMVYQTAATEADQRKYPPNGVLVNVDGYRMHINCVEKEVQPSFWTMWAAHPWIGP